MSRVVLILDFETLNFSNIILVDLYCSYIFYYIIYSYMRNEENSELPFKFSFGFTFCKEIIEVFLSSRVVSSIKYIHYNNIGEKS